MNTTSSRARDRFARTATRIAPLVAAIGFGLGKAASAATIVVDDASAASVPGKCSIIDAVAAVNTQAAVNACSAGDGSSDTIDLHGFAAPTTITLTQAAGSHALSLTRPAAIRGSLAPDGTPFVTLERSGISGTPSFGLLMSLAPLTIDGLILQNGSTQSGYCGGAIAAGDVLTVTNSVIRANSSSGGGGGIFATAHTELRKSVVTGNSAVVAGGGIVATYSLNISYSTFSNNATTAPDGNGGGAMYVLTGTTIDHSTITGNTSSTAGGGIYSRQILSISDSTISNNAAHNGAGGGIYALDYGVSVKASTISGNSATMTGGGINTSSADMTNSTFAGNQSGGAGAGVFATNITSVYSTFSANTSQGGTGGGMMFVTSAVANGSIIYGNAPDDVSSVNHVPPTGAFDLIGVSPWGVPAGTLSCDPKLGALGDHGGSTATMQLGDGSCAMNAASATPSVATDQRDYARPAVQGGKADIGSSESNSTQTAPTDQVFGNGFE